MLVDTICGCPIRARDLKRELLALGFQIARMEVYPDSPVRTVALATLAAVRQRQGTLLGILTTEEES